MEKDQVKKFGLLLLGQGYTAGKDRASIEKRKRPYGPEELRKSLMDVGVNGNNAWSMGEWVIEWFHAQKDRLRTENETKNKSTYVDLLESNHGLLVRDNNSEQCYLTNLNNWHSTEFKMKSLEMECASSGVEDPRALILNNFRSAIFEYEPYRFEKLFDDGNDHRFNTFQPPTHFFNLDKIEGDWQSLKDFFKHLFTKDEDYQYVLDWMANSLIHKNNIFLLFPAAKGVGKNFLGERVLLPLYGQSNFSYNRNEDIKSKFNAALADKQLAVVDEFTIEGTKDNDALKIFTNSFVAVEEKFQARKTKKISCNIMLFTNRTNKLRLSKDQRRYSILPLTELKLDLNEELMAKYGTVDNLGKEIEKDIPAFYKFLRNRSISRNMNLPMIDMELFDKIIYDSATTWESVVTEMVEELKSGNKITFEDLQQEVEEQGGTRVKISTIADYLKGLEICSFNKSRPKKSTLVERL